MSYRSAIFYIDDEQRRVAEDTIADVEASGLWPGQGRHRGDAGGAVLGGRARAPGLPRALSRTATRATSRARAGCCRAGPTPSRASRIALLLVAAALAAAAATAPGGTAAVAAPTCTTAGLDVWLNTAGDGTAQGTIHDLNFTNLSGHACRIARFPGVSAVDLAGHRIGHPAKRDATHPGVVLANGATATAALLIVNVSKFPASICRPRLAAGLRVYPPNQVASRIVPFPFRACSRPAPVFVLIQAVTT